ncbi:MAG: phosphate ABC transporter substrate-binding/OmpA family protein [Sedimentitalea sp.]
MAWYRAAIIAALLLFGPAETAEAQDVTLTSRDGTVEITGTLLGFDGEFYRVNTQFGDLTVDGTGVVCDGPGCPSLTDYVAEVAFSGSSTMGEVLLPALVEGFALRNAYQATRVGVDSSHFEYELARSGQVLGRFSFRVTNTDEGFADLLANEADVVMALREIRPDELSRAREAGMGDMTGRNRSRVLALDAIVPIVTARHPVSNISVPQLAAVLAGEVTNWSELGGPDAPIAVHMPSEGSGLSQSVEDSLLEPVEKVILSDVTRHPKGSDLVRAVINDPFAIGMASFAETGAARALILTGECGFSLEASRRSIKTEDYPLTSPMFLYLPTRRLPKLVREFLSYTNGPSAQIVIRRAGFVDQMPEQIPVNAQGDRFANAIMAAGPEVDLAQLKSMMRALRPMQRLTLSFRFERGSSRPDAQSRANITQLARAIETGVYDARRLVFVGFSDGQGAAQRNLVIARSRAENVRNQVLELAEVTAKNRVPVAVQAHGESLPMACDDSDWGRKTNRRVEVWVR